MEIFLSDDSGGQFEGFILEEFHEDFCKLGDNSETSVTVMEKELCNFFT